MKTPGEMAAVMRRAAERVVPDLELTVAEVLRRAQRIATTTPGVGRREWPEFAEATQFDRRWQGPLRRTGDLADSFRVEQEGLRGELVSSEGYIVYSELGTSREPPRPLLVPSIRDAQREVGVTRLRFTLSRILR